MTGRPVLLDLCCGDGGAGEGYRRAGFDVFGVDRGREVRPGVFRPFTYPPGEFWQADVLEVLRELVATGEVWGHRPDVVHASFPCKRFTDLAALDDTTDDRHPDLLTPGRELLQAWGGPYVIENVEGAPLIDPLTLCGSEFGLWADCADGRRRWLRRHRLFESNVWLMGAGGCNHPRTQPIGVYGTGGGGQMTRGYKGNLTESRQAMGMPWGDRDAVSQAIPPVYAEFIGEQLLAHVRQETPACLPS